MATRDIFPFEPDRYVIDQFLRGLPRSDASSDYIRIENNRLLFQDTTILAWYDTAGALIVMPMPRVAALGYATHIVHYMLDQLGIDTRIVREETTDPALPRFKFYLADQEITVGAPVTLAGPLTVQAYRASKPRQS